MNVFLSLNLPMHTEAYFPTIFSTLNLVRANDIATGAESIWKRSWLKKKKQGDRTVTIDLSAGSFHSKCPFICLHIISI